MRFVLTILMLIGLAGVPVWAQQSLDQSSIRTADQWNHHKNDLVFVEHEEKSKVKQLIDDLLSEPRKPANNDDPGASAE